jgi:threonine dehydrogenase-like Zn-dependent dehydrogenase
VALWLAPCLRARPAHGVPVGEDSALLPSLLTLSDVFCTGHHAAVTAGVNPRTSVTVIGDGAVGLSAVLAAKRPGAERIVLMGRHEDRTDLGREFGATDIVAERGDEGIARVRDLTGGVAPPRAYIEDLLPDVLEGRIEPGRVVDRTVGFDLVPDGDRAMADREALKVLIQPRPAVLFPERVPV